MCNYPECLAGIEFSPEGSSIQVGYGYIDGRKFSALVRDSRGEGTEHLHFPAEDFGRFAQTARPERLRLFRR
jgi:hypothetical protein